MKTFYYEYVEDCIAYLLISQDLNGLYSSNDTDLENFLESLGIFQSAECMYETDFGFDIIAFENEAKKFGISMISTTFTN